MSFLRVSLVFSSLFISMSTVRVDRRLSPISWMVEVRRVESPAFAMEDLLVEAVSRLGRGSSS